MPIIQTTRLDDILAFLPELQPFDSELISKNAPNCLIIGAGFEDRAMWMLEEVDLKRFSKIVVISYRQSGDIPESLKTHKNACVIEFDKATLLSNLVCKLNQVTQSSEERINFIVDVSSMSSVSIYSVLGVLFDGFDKDDLSLAYCEAGEYLPSQAEWDEFAKSLTNYSTELELAEAYCERHSPTSGVSYVSEFPLFPGRNEGPRKTKIVAIPGFGFERVKTMLTFAEENYDADASQPFWVFGSPPARKNHWRLQALVTLFNRSGKIDSAAVSTRMYKELLRLLDDTYSRFDDKHIVIASTGSKLQHVATFLFLWMRPDAGLILSQPKSYRTKRYSVGLGPKWHLNFGSIQETKTELSNIDKLRFVWD